MLQSIPLNLSNVHQVFHEPLFRQRYQTLLESDQVAYHEESFLWLFAVVVALGAKYEARATTASVQRTALEKLSLDLLAQVEARFLNLIGCATLEAVQICILVGSCLLFSGRPNVGLGISAAGVKIAQVINLHREKRWTDSSAAVRETKRRTWWALEVYDKYGFSPSMHGWKLMVTDTPPLHLDDPVQLTTPTVASI